MVKPVRTDRITPKIILFYMILSQTLSLLISTSEYYAQLSFCAIFVGMHNELRVCVGRAAKMIYAALIWYTTVVKASSSSSSSLISTIIQLS